MQMTSQLELLEKQKKEATRSDDDQDSSNGPLVTLSNTRTKRDQESDLQSEKAHAKLDQSLRNIEAVTDLPNETRAASPRLLAELLNNEEEVLRILHG